MNPVFDRELDQRDIFSLKAATRVLVTTCVTPPLVPTIGPDAAFSATNAAVLVADKLIDKAISFVSPRTPKKP